jgi:hypothetical protein
MNLIILYDFMQVLNIKRMHYTKNEYFLSIFYLLQFIYSMNRNQIIEIILSRN